MRIRIARRLTAWVIITAGTVTLIPNPAFPHSGALANSTSFDVLDTVVPEYKFDNRPIRDVVQGLFATVDGVDVGFEDVLKGKFSDPELPSHGISVDLSDATLRTALFAICAADPRYTWSMDGATVNIYPQAVSSDPEYLMNRELYTFHLEDALDIQDGLLGIVHQLPPPAEQAGILQAGGDSSYPPEPWTATYERLTVRQAVNRIAEHMGGSTSWFFSGSRDFRHFAFFRRPARSARK